LIERPLVPIDAEPGEPVQNRLDRLGGGTGAIGVLDAQDEGAPVMPCVEVAEQGRSRAANVQKAGRAGGKTRPDRHGAWLCAGRTQCVKLSTRTKALRTLG